MVAGWCSTQYLLQRPQADSAYNPVTMPNNVLLVTPASPLTPQSGAQQRTALLHAALQGLGEVDVLLLEPTPGASRLISPEPGIHAHALWHQHPFGIRKFQPDPVLNHALKANGIDLEKYQIIVSRYLNPISKLFIPPGVRTVVDLDDWGYHYASDTLASRLKSTYAARLAQKQLKRFDAFFFVSSRDQAHHPELRSVILPNIPFNPPAQPFPQTDSATLLFVGSLWYAPNREGIDRFLQHSWPTIKATLPHKPGCCLRVPPRPPCGRPGNAIPVCLPRDMLMTWAKPIATRRSPLLRSIPGVAPTSRSLSHWPMAGYAPACHGS